jgi:hypothetical protein
LELSFAGPIEARELAAVHDSVPVPCWPDDGEIARVGVNSVPRAKLAAKAADKMAAGNRVDLKERALLSLDVAAVIGAVAMARATRNNRAV